MDPLLKWPGGKKREALYVRRFLPEHFDRYIEPFFGGGGVCFTLLGDYPDVPVVANDIDGDLIRFYRLVQSNSPELRRHLSAQAEEWRRLETVAAGEGEIVVTANGELAPLGQGTTVIDAAGQQDSVTFNLKL